MKILKDDMANCILKEENTDDYSRYQNPILKH